MISCWFAQRNPKPCPILEVTEVGERMTHICAKDCDVATDFPGYRIYKDGVMVDEVDDVVDYWRDDLVAFIIGCSFSFESELIEAGIEMRHNTQGRNVSMYLTNGVRAGRLHERQHGGQHAPHPLRPGGEGGADLRRHPEGTRRAVHIGDPSVIGIKDIAKPDFGDPVDINPGEVPVFWACGVTPQSIVMNSKPPFAITHAPGYMLITDTKNVDLKG